MKFIKKVTLENFQSHVHTELEFSKGLNVILGHSDSGKTAILRAIRWCLYNEPGGLEFMRKEASEVKVVLLFQNDLQITRSRTRSINRYIIDYPDGEQLILEGFGSGVPQEVIEATGIERIQLDEKESSAINYSAQLDGPFLLNMSDSVKAAAIGRLVGVNILDDTLRDTLRDKKQLTQRKGSYQEQISSYEKQIKSYDYVDDEQKKLNKLSKIAESIDSLSKGLERMKKMERDYTQLHKEKVECQRTLQSLDQLDKVSQTIESLNYRSFKLDHYQKLKTRVSALATDQRIVQESLENTSFVDKLGPILREIQDKNVKLVQLTPYLNKLQQLKIEKSNLLSKQEHLKSIEDIDLIKLKNSLHKLYRLDQIHASLSKIYNKYKVADQFLAEFKDLDKVSLIVKELEDSVFRLNHLNQEKIKVRDLYKKSAKQTKEKEKAEKYIHSTLNEFTQVFKKIKICPLCHQPLESDAYEHLIHYFKGEDSFEL